MSGRIGVPGGGTGMAGSAGFALGANVPASVGSVVDRNAPWYQQAVVYEVFLRGFHDANGDGIGDLRGLTERLDYLQWLGVDCVWLLPFYPSPMRDGGYDVADLTGVHPDYGTLDDAVTLVEEAHRRGIRVIADLVVNHTSEQHPWFQESRSSRDNPKADWYVWGDDPNRWSEARVIFVDYEASNWTWDPVREQFYWHRFYSHQPDLNYDNPEVRAAMLAVVDHWLGLGLDGLRLDAVPYLFEADGTNGENLPATHEFLRVLRAHVDERHPGRVLLAEANQWPQDVVAYFGDGDECHMAFHFPLMPRMFMALRRGDATPVQRILADMPPIPEGCQWAIFLRNHDELTLEMVTDEERDYMYAQYVTDPRMRRNIGISRRLFPLVEGDRRQAELLHSLLFTLPGTPVLYYGDEIGMGDNVHLGDRDAVRTPMQWTPDRNGGFSRADFASLYLPPSLDPVYGFAVRNVESSTRSPASFLQWIRRMIAVRQRNPVLGLGGMLLLETSNSAVLAYLRLPTNPAQRPILCVANFSAAAQPADVEVPGHVGWTPLEVLGGVAFPPIREEPYRVALAPFGFLSFELAIPDATALQAAGAVESAAAAIQHPTTVEVATPPHEAPTGTWDEAGPDPAQ
ncbi:MAG: maltose alpha-D-glucosyltransferase [Candidatus Nanopelagicales bacterium]|jgi:maltose alpha-D-glucosyltransferase/alpha-amylase|nr:maltose alpha-D-glucosyltransferase [Candidatus Nanopelagicales bacterium]